MKDQSRNLNPHKAAVVATWLWGKAYSNQRGGSMDYWYSLSEGDREVCRDLVKRIAEAPEERGAHVKVAAP